MENTEQSILEDTDIKLVPASAGKRFANYLIDVIIFSFLLSFILILVAPVYPLSQKIIAKEPLSLMDQLMVSFLYGLYMSAMEAILKGKTIGKYITGTRAVDENGIPIAARAAFIRGLVRIIPLEQLSAISLSFTPFSFLSPSPWHDKWAGAVVADENKSRLPNKTI